MTQPRKGWATTSIGAIAELINGRAFKPGDWGKAGLPIVRIQNLNNSDAQFNYFAGKVAERHMVRSGDLLFAWSGTPGTSFGAHIWRGPDAVLNQHIFNVRVDEKSIDREFLGYAINQTLSKQVAKAHGGAGLRHVTKGAFESTLIDLPPLLEQKRIVARLRGAGERITTVLQQLRQALDQANAARAALLQGAYELSLLPPERRAAYSPNGGLVAVGEIAESLTYGSSAKSSSKGKVPVLRMGNIQDGELDWSNLVYSSDEREIERYALKTGDVLFNRTNGSPLLVGKTAVYRGEKPAIFAGYLIRIRCAERMVPDYLAICLNSPPGRRYCQAVRSNSGGQSNINSKKLAAFRLPCPSVRNQQVLVNAVRTGLDRLASITRQILDGQHATEALHRRLIQKGLAGELATFDDGDENAAIQIERLAAAKQILKNEDSYRIVSGGEAMPMDVAEILKGAGGWMTASEVAARFGITRGAGTEIVEPFYAELRALHVAGKLLAEPVRDDKGLKIGERLRLRVTD